jgi:gliding motility-associated-like protein
MKRILFFAIFVFLLILTAKATHQRAGEITYRWITGYTYEVTIVTYTYTPSLADRPELTLNWGDGTSDVIKRLIKEDLPNNISRNVYGFNTADPVNSTGRHTYVGAARYVLSMEDPNRNYGIYNIPNSVNVPFYLETVLIINPFLGGNSSPVLLNPPIDNACINEIFIHNPWAYDPDGDSLSYRLDTCMTTGGVDIPGFFQPPASNYLSVDPIIGDLTWDSPMFNGEYNVAILIEEWRHGIKIGSVLRDLQITVVPCDNHPPVITNILDTCILAGTLLNINISATDPDNDVITLTGNGGPLILSDGPAHFIEATGTGSVSSMFTWQTQCSHVQKQPYQANFKAEDNSIPVHLVDFSTLRITVVGPAPENLTATPLGTSINLKWNKSKCLNAIGYRIYRRNGYYGFFPDHCETGVPAYTGYVEIDEVPDIYDTTYTDNNNGAGLIHGNDYCYMVIAYYPDGAESYASLEACAILKKDVPVITHVSVNYTDVSIGAIFVDWSKPTELDTIAAPGPYKYLIYRAPQLSGGTFQLIDSLGTLNDTVFIDTLINTNDLPYHYRIDLWNNTPTPGGRFFIGPSHAASSVFLKITPHDNRLILNWSYDVPWTNETHTIYRQNPSTLLFDSIATTDTNTYTDAGLVNGASYCYKVKTIGSYSAPGYVDPIENFSQETCGSPIDNEPPCAPVLTVITDCELITNLLTWTNPNHSCAGDVIQYNIYYSPDPSSDFNLIQTIYNPDDTSFLHSGLTTITGCYTVVAIDSFSNISPYSNVVCLDIDICYTYSLPNVFTPNNDGFNDLFIPFPYDFVESVNMSIFNRWGVKLFETHDPDINWDGKNSFTRLACADGVYYFVCEVFEQRMGGITKRTITGWVHLIR